MKVLYHHRTRGKGAEGVHILGIVKAMRELGMTVDIMSMPGADPGNRPVAVAVHEYAPAAVGIATLGEPVGAAALAFVVLDEVPRMTTLVGCTITLAAVALALRASRR